MTVSATLPLPPLFPKKAVDPTSGATVARTTLGLVAYLRDPVHWANGGAADLLRAYCGYVAPSELQWLTTSMMHRWVALDGLNIEGLAAPLVASFSGRQLRPLFRFDLVDDRAAPLRGFRYQENEPERDAPSTSWLQLWMHPRQDPDALLGLMLELVQQHPVLYASAGYVLSWNSDRAAAAFEHGFRQASRYLGLDLPHPESTSRNIATGGALPSANWLNYIDGELAEALGLNFPAPSGGVAVLPLRRGTLLRAGERPRLIDVNQMEHSPEYSAVAAQLDAARRGSPSLPGVFDEAPDSTRGWLDRFTRPEYWPR
ncbi:hypothetical protein ENSA5_11790 [Enhygromyxa salina]|uniref:DUF3396 domain-containing protein n=1 Tax=Enhygromyxa salina TaxID=215803 RepID=A0A2S9YG52_9BACT|nr:type VI immunity family protein [Enhygromyxa salina]PRQ03996.1 hypothetical protein ENSA5_11790 [Enhygromyxa salina]